MSEAVRLHVAGAWHARARIRDVMTALEATRRFRVTFDWTTADCAVAVADLRGVQQADVVLGWFEDAANPYRDAWTEVGAALALDKPVLLYCPWRDTLPCLQHPASALSNVFFHHPRVSV